MNFPEKMPPQPPENIEAMSVEETRRMLHELQVHQIELEMQNEELRAMHAELDSAKARYFDLYDMAPVGYCTLSDKGLILETNLTAATLLSLNRNALLKQPLTRYILPDDQNIYFLHRKQLFETGEPQTCDLRMVKNGGTQFWAHLAATAAQDIDSALVSRVVISDIAERKQAEMEKANLEAQNRQLQKAESLERMAGAIAHHFNNQLCAVMGNLEMVMDDLSLGVNSNESLVSAMQAARKAAEVSRLMLTYLGQTPGEHAPIDMAETCLISLNLLQAAAPKSMIIDADFSSSSPVIRANAGQIMQVLTILVTNAWESASDNPCTICLTVKTVSNADISSLKRFPIDWQPLEIAYACLEVSDTGCGIPEREIEKLFDPFYSTKFTGRGMALSVLLGIVKAHNGGITVESEPGRGSVFRVFLPVSAEEVHRQPDKPAQPPEIQEGGTVLLTEDEEQVRKMARTMLTYLGSLLSG